MTDFSKITPEELNKMDKSVLITIIGVLQNQLNGIRNQLNFLTEQIALMNQRSFGRKTEQLEEMHQLTIYDYFNETEALSDDSDEPEIERVVVSTHSRKAKSKREDKLEGLPARIYEHKIDPEKLAEIFPNGYKELPVETYKRLSIIPQTFIVDEHHIHVYASKNNDGTIVRADRTPDLFRNSLATPSLVSFIMTGKYLKHLPLERQVTCFKDNGIDLGTNTMANWMMNAADQYLYILYEELHKYLYEAHVLHADETPFQVIENNLPSKSKSYMWVYRNGACDSKHPVIIYNYQKSRNATHPEEFLKGYSGTLVTDGYQVYHTLDKKRDDIRVAGCWVHAKRKFAELVKAIGTEKADGIVAAEATKRISEIFHLDNQLDNLDKTERKKQRQQVIKPKVDDFFVWAKKAILQVPPEGKTSKGLQYCINQEPYLRVFLSDGNVPMDNNLAEQAIRPFTLGRKNWVNMFSVNGAQSSAIIYSIVETAKANNLRVFDYLEHVLTVLAEHANDSDREFIQEILPWSETVQKKCKIPKKI